MPWFRVGDTAAGDPRITALEDPKDPLIGAACFGFLMKLGIQSANHRTDYVIYPGFLHVAGGAAALKLLKRCIAAGLIVPLPAEGRGPAGKRWKLIDTAPELFHIRLNAEIEWEKQQKSDTSNLELRTAVYLRDGDSCRWCGKVVQPNDNRSARGRSLDHLRSGESARGPEDLVVACFGCNGRRGKDWKAAQGDDQALAAFTERWQLRPPPSPLIFVQSTVRWLEKRGHTVPAGSVIAERADTLDPSPAQPRPAATHPANAGVAAPAPAPEDQHPASQAGVAAPTADPGTDATRPATQAGAAASPAPASTHDAPEGQHPAPAGVAAPESRTDRLPTDRSGGAGPGRAGAGPGLAGSGGSPPTRASPALPPQPAPISGPRRTRRGRRRTRPGGTS